MVYSVKWFILVLISWCFFLFKENIPLTNAEEYFPFKLQFISFLLKSDPEDTINVSDKLFSSCSILENEYLILPLFFVSIL